MSRNRSRRIHFDDALRDAKQAAQMYELIEILLDEQEGYKALLDFVGVLLKKHYPRHLKLTKLIGKVGHNTAFYSAALNVLLREYRAYLADFEHQYGEIDAPSLRGLLNYTISLEDLLEVFPIESAVEDFLDG